MPFLSTATGHLTSGQGFSGVPAVWGLTVGWLISIEGKTLWGEGRTGVRTHGSVSVSPVGVGAARGQPWGQVCLRMLQETSLGTLVGAAAGAGPTAGGL